MWKMLEVITITNSKTVTYSNIPELNQKPVTYINTFFKFISKALIKGFFIHPIEED